MSDNNITDLKEAQKQKRKKKGWTQEEIEQKAAEELLEYEKLAEGEPEDLASGDMEKITEGKDDDEKAD